MALIICEALYDFRGAEGQPSPLVFDVGDEIFLIKKDQSGWWEGEKDGERGYFPAAYVREKEVIPSTPETEEEEPPPDIEPLPPGWREAKAPDGRTYYFLKKTKETTWKRPTARNTTDGNSIIKKTNSERSSMQRPERKHTRGLSDASSLGNSPPSSPGPYFDEDEEDKPVYYVVNGVCLPDAKRAKEQELLQPGRYSYCDYFWRDKGEKHVYESGFSTLLSKMQKGKQICKEMSELFKAREALELQYAKGLASLSAELFAETEEGTMYDAWKQLKGSLAQESKIHRDFAAKLRTEIEKPLADYKDEGKKEMKKIEGNMNELRKQMTHKYQAVERDRITMAERQKELDVKIQSPKKEEDVAKARRKSTKYREDLIQSITVYNDAKDKWFEEMVTQSLVLENKEIKRLELITKQMNKYSKLVNSVSAKTEKACSSVTARIAEVDPAKDRELWVKKNKTGTVRPVDMDSPY